MDQTSRVYTNLPNPYRRLGELLPGEWVQLHQYWIGMVTIPPESAVILLANNNRNQRKRTIAQVNRIVNSLKNNTWVLNGETIIFDTESNCRNGQHRLDACAKSGVPLETFVIVGFGPESFTSYDQTVARRLQHILGSRGEPNAEILSSAIQNLMVFLGAGHLGRAESYNKKIKTVDDKLAILDAHPGLRDSAEFTQSNRRDAMIFSGLGLMCSMHYIFSQVDKSLADTFFNAILKVSMPETPKWTVPHLLLKKLIENATSKAKLDPESIAAMTVKAWNAFLSNKTAGHIRFSSIEKFPLVSGWYYDDDDKPTGTTRVS